MRGKRRAAGLGRYAWRVTDRRVPLVVTPLLVLDLIVLGGLVYYTSDMTHCWDLADSGRLIGCGPHVPGWGWVLAVGIGISLLSLLLVRLRRSN